MRLFIQFGLDLGKSCGIQVTVPTKTNTRSSSKEGTEKSKIIYRTQGSDVSVFPCLNGLTEDFKELVRADFNAVLNCPDLHKQLQMCFIQPISFQNKLYYLKSTNQNEKDKLKKLEIDELTLLPDYDVLEAKHETE
jgi:hypothetical protein